MGLADKTDAEIENWIANHEGHPGATELPFYRQLLEERARRAQKRQLLIFDKSLDHLTKAAVAQKCTTYGALAEASGVAWSKARRQMNGPHGHLDRLLDLCHARGLPLLTAICVNQAGVVTGELEDAALAGFVAGAKRLGLTVTSERAFHHRCRDECWAWGREQEGMG